MKFTVAQAYVVLVLALFTGFVNESPWLFWGATYALCILTTVAILAGGKFGMSAQAQLEEDAEQLRGLK